MQANDDVCFQLLAPKCVSSVFGQKKPKCSVRFGSRSIEAQQLSLYSVIKTRTTPAQRVRSSANPATGRMSGFCSRRRRADRPLSTGATEAQDLTGATAQLKAAGCQKIDREKTTGTTADRPQLKKLVAALVHGDVVIVPAVDRLSRDTTDLLNIARDMHPQDRPPEVAATIRR
jgi:hypothetical protein